MFLLYVRECDVEEVVRGVGARGGGDGGVARTEHHAGVRGQLGGRGVRGEPDTGLTIYAGRELLCHLSNSVILT